jgi:FkbM family methyltransferase
MRPTALGFDFIGVEGMPESRSASGEVELLRGLLQSAEAFVDVGANCGLFTLIACRAGVPVLAFEPNQENFQLLLRNLAHNRCTGAEAFQVALSSQPGVMPLFGGGEGGSLESNWGGMTHTYSRLVSVNTLDNLVSGRFPDRRLVIKIDVEGHEYGVLSGADKLLARMPSPTWLIEHGFRENFSGGINPRFREVFERFWSHGYECHTADAVRRPVCRDDVQRWIAQGERDFGDMNYLFWRNGS